MTNEEVRKQLVEVLDTYGMKIKFIADKLEINYNNLTSFKSGKVDYSTEYLNKLKVFLDKYN